MRHVRLLIIIIGIFQSCMSFAQLEPSTTFSGEPKMVEVEPTNVIITENKEQSSLLAYRERRPTWGKTFAVSYSTFEPTFYEPNFLQVNFEDIYTRAEMPLIEFQFTVKRNMSFGSLGAELSAGIYQNESDADDLIESSLQLVPIKLGGIFFLDTIGPEPYFVPYVASGAYVMLYKETNNSVTFKGNTQVAPYFSGGLAFSIDWIDRAAARVSYEDSGIEATYAFAEARTQMAAGDELDPDFSSDVSFAGGLRVEF